jgi:hypothetical protein
VQKLQIPLLRRGRVAVLLPVPTEPCTQDLNAVCACVCSEGVYGLRLNWRWQITAKNPERKREKKREREIETKREGGLTTPTPSTKIPATAPPTRTANDYQSK